MVVAALVAAVIVAVGVPFSAIVHQHRALAAASAQLRAVDHENTLLAEQQQALSTGPEVDRLARELYQLVPPGSQLFDVLPPAGHAAPTGGGTPTGDPADQPLVSPSDAPGLLPDPGLPASTTAPGPSARSAGSDRPTTTTAASGGFVGRVLSTLEFWK